MNRHTALFSLLIFLFGCPKAENSANSEATGSNSSESKVIPPQITLSAERTDVIYSYRSGSRFVTASKISEIPEDARQQVVVTDLSLSPAERQASKYIYVADLRKPRADGNYPVSIASRYGLEAKIAKSQTASIAEPGASNEVIVYSTSWCGVCKKAMKLLNSWGVAYTEKDIEGSRKAKNELAAKAQAAGIQPGGVPVIDVHGILLQGLDEASLKSALQSKGLL